MALVQQFDWIFHIVLIVLALMMILCLFRAIIGPRMADRLIAINMMGTMVMTIICIMAVILNESSLVDGDMYITSSSNGRDSNGNLVLRFEASFTLNKEPMNFNNKHMMAIAPGGKNVTDSYVQIEGMFGKAAEDCQSSDVVCTNNTQNVNGEKNGS